MKPFVKIGPCILLPIFLLRFLTGASGVNGQTVEVVIKVPSLFALNPLPGESPCPSGEGSAGNGEKSLKWLEITGDENVEILVHFAQREDSVVAWYINTGVFDVDDAVPFDHNRASFILNAAYGKFVNQSRFKAWIGLGNDTAGRLTLEYL